MKKYYKIGRKRFSIDYSAPFWCILGGIAAGCYFYILYVALAIITK